MAIRLREGLSYPCGATWDGTGANSRKWWRCHEAGLEIILDVVYNHTSEGNEKGPSLSFKGIDNEKHR